MYRFNQFLEDQFILILFQITFFLSLSHSSSLSDQICSISPLSSLNLTLLRKLTTTVVSELVVLGLSAATSHGRRDEDEELRRTAAETGSTDPDRFGLYGSTGGKGGRYLPRCEGIIGSQSTGNEDIHG